MSFGREGDEHFSVEAKHRNEFNEVQGRTQKPDQRISYRQPNDEFKEEPDVADKLNIKESWIIGTIWRIWGTDYEVLRCKTCLWMEWGVQGDIMECSSGKFQSWNSEWRSSFEAVGHDRKYNADNGNQCNTLKMEIVSWGTFMEKIS